jgi:vacuolar-type H+-ATPase subunit H
MLTDAAREAPERRSLRVFLCLVDRNPRDDPVRRSAARSCVEKEGRLEAPRDPLLQDLIHHEKTVAGKVEEARAEAERIVAQARTEAREAIERARRDAEAHVREASERAAEEAEAARRAIVDAARAEVAELEAQAAARREAAVALVMEQVLP